MPKNFLALEGELVARLKEQLSSQVPPVHVLTSSELADVVEEKQLTPAVHVMYRGYAVGEGRYDGKACPVMQSWLAVVVTRSTRNLASGLDARQQAGALAGVVLEALMGFKPASSSKPLMLVNAPQADYSGGHQYIPFGFAIETVQP
jgi:phage gp37-like protein